MSKTRRSESLILAMPPTRRRCEQTLWHGRAGIGQTSGIPLVGRDSRTGVRLPGRSHGGRLESSDRGHGNVAAKANRDVGPEPSQTRLVIPRVARLVGPNEENGRQRRWMEIAIYK